MQNQPTSSSFQEATKSAPVVIQEDGEPGNASDPAGNQTSNPPKEKEAASLIEEPLESGEIPHPRTSSPADTSSPLKEPSVDPLLLESDQGEETNEGDSSSILPMVPFKTPRGRKSKKKQREEATYLAVLDSSQKTLKGIMNTRSKKGTGPASKGATSPHRY